MHPRLAGLSIFLLLIVSALLIVGVPRLSGQWRSNSDEGGDKTKSESGASGLPAPYTIQPNDLLEIFVWKEPDLTRKVLVRPDGRISFPLIQDLPAAGVSPAELKDAIEKGLKEFLDAPNVTVTVDAIQSYRVYVTGKVLKAGILTMEKPVTVLQALALAGGFQEFANPSEVIIISSDKTSVKFNYAEVIKGKNSDQNIRLKSGDVVVVP